MPNRIKDIWIQDYRLDPAEAEVWITVFPERVTSGTRVEGRLTGPRCPYASTVEVAYPLREHLRYYEREDQPRIVLRVLIPEPNLWDPISPFLYEGTLELWDGRDRCEQRSMCHGLRTVTLGPRGLRWNQQPLTVRGLALGPGAGVDCRGLHDAGYNALVVPVSAESARLWDEADRYGLLMVGRIATKEGVQQARALADHASAFAWLLRVDRIGDQLVQADGTSPAVLAGLWHPREGQLIGVELREAPRGPLPQGVVHFVACGSDVLAHLGPISLPRLLLGDEGGGAAETSPSPNLLGWVQPAL
jgi:hypothetical protein